MLITNTERHLRTGLVVDPFGSDGSIRCVPVEGDMPGRAFILDATAASELASFIEGLKS